MLESNQNEMAKYGQRPFCSPKKLPLASGATALGSVTAEIVGGALREP
jgi:hypothetical protein